jgi:hypothetical protein
VHTLQWCKCLQKEYSTEQCDSSAETCVGYIQQLVACLPINTYVAATNFVLSLVTALNTQDEFTAEERARLLQFTTGSSR